jgi:hypothetical protein
MAASRTMVFVSSSDDGPLGFPEVPAGTAEDAVPPADEVVAGAAVVGGVVVLAVGGTVPGGIVEVEDPVPGAVEVAVPGAVELPGAVVLRGAVELPGAVVLRGAVELPCDWPGACAEAGRGAAAASAAQQIPTVTRRGRIRCHRLTKTRTRPPAPSLIAARR